MRRLRLASISLFLFLPACGPPASSGTDNGDDSSGSSGASESSGDGGGVTSNDPTGGGEGDTACVPGKAEFCPCVGGGQGHQTCLPDGSGFGPCDCADGTTTVSSDATTDVTTAETTHATTDHSSGDTDVSSTSSDATTDMTASSDGGEASSGEESSTGAPGCVDDDDAPGSEQNARKVGDQDCNDDPKEFAGVLDGAGDADWYTWNGDWTGNCGILADHPNVLHELDAGGGVRLCVFVECAGNTTADFECGNGSQSNMSPGGLQGCCDDQGLEFDLDCVGGLGAEDDAQVFVRVDMADADACVDYTITYSYQDG